MDDRGTKVYIGNCVGITEEEIRDEFSRFGRLDNKIWIARNPPGFAFVWYEDERDAMDAVKELDGKEICGRTLKVEISKQDSSRREPYGDRDRYDDRSRGGGYRGREGGYGGGGGYGRGNGYRNGGGYGRDPPPMGNRGRGGGPRKTGFKVRIYNLPQGSHWTELKDFVRKAGEVIYANCENDEGIAEFADREGMERAHRELDGSQFGERRIQVEIQDESNRFRKFGHSPERRRRNRSEGRRGHGREYSRSPRRRYSRSPSYHRSSSYHRRSRSKSVSHSRSVSRSRSQKRSPSSSLKDEKRLA
mmetsp:Transcript_2538/g.3748  ORF Transcript_2538/g.3748 Transcript_2538/m.3748 type:complete len:304 (+) Transcript_2538:78-989(+)